MLIPPAPYTPQVLLPVPRRQWRAPSAAQPKDQFGNPNLVLQRLTARTHDGRIMWVGWFEDRDEADAFLHAILLHQVDGRRVPKSLWELPQQFRWPGFPEWFAQRRYWTPWSDDLADAVYAVDTTVSLTSPTGSLQSYPKPGDFPNGANNTIGLIASGGRGASQNSAQARATGGGGGEFGGAVNFSFTGSSAQYEIGATNTASSVGPSTWWDGTSDTSCTLSALGGGTGHGANTGSIAGGDSGTGGVGSLHNAGGQGGNHTSGGGSTGGAAAGNPAGVGNSGVANSATGATGDGLNSGGGGDGGKPAADGDPYGGGGGGSAASSGASGGDGAQGFILLTYTPAGGVKYTQLERAIRGLGRGLMAGSLH